MVGAPRFFLDLGFDFVFNEIFRMIHGVDVDEETKRDNVGDVLGPWVVHHIAFIHAQVLADLSVFADCG